MPAVTDLWKRIVTPDDPALAPDVARYFLTLALTDKEKARYKVLAAREQAELRPEEQAELEAFVHASTLIMLLQSKARLALKKTQPAA